MDLMGVLIGDTSTIYLLHPQKKKTFSSVGNMLRVAGQTRNKTKLARIPPWRKWVRGRQEVSEVSLTRSIDPARVAGSISFDKDHQAKLMQLGSIEAQNAVDRPSPQLSLAENATVTLAHLSRFLHSRAPLSRHIVKELDGLCEMLLESLHSMCMDDRIRIMTAFSQLRQFSVVNRVVDRYNNLPLSYVNHPFYEQLVKSIDWETLYRTYLSQTGSLAPLMLIIRTVNRLGLNSQLVHHVLNAIFTDLLALPKTFEQKPKQLTELIMIAAKNRFTHNDLFELVVRDVESNHNSYTEDLIGDIARSFTTLNYYSATFHGVLSRELPTNAHELSWWNLIDVADYYVQVVPKPFSDMDNEILSRLSNECWKWIPDMRSGYAAKALRVLSLLDVSDRRTIRSLIRHIPRSLGKLHQNVVAESLISAARVGYHPRLKYGKRYGSLLYRRLAGKLVTKDPRDPNSSKSPLASVSGSLIVDVVDALASIQRPQNELFDFVVIDILAFPGKYSTDQLVSLERTFKDKFGFRRGTKVISRLIRERQSSGMSVRSLAFLAREDTDALSALMETGSAELSQLTVSEVSPLLNDPRMASFVQKEWLDFNLSNMESQELVELCEALARRHVKVDDIPLGLIQTRACSSEVGWSSADSMASFIGSILLLSGLNTNAIPSCLLSRIVSTATTSPNTVYMCQLIAGFIRVSPPVKIDDSTFQFLQWVEGHLLSRYPQPVDSGDYRDFYVPNGAVTDLSVFPATIPLALPDPRIDLDRLHHSRTSTSVRRVLSHVSSDSGIALFPRNPLMNPPSVPDLLTRCYLESLGWTVKDIDHESDIGNATVVTVALMGEPKHTLSMKA